MTTPKKERILRRGKAIAMERQVRVGLPAITPSEQELKESGVFHEAQISEMQVSQEAVAQQMSYLQGMASELKLRVIPLKGLRSLKRETGYEWTNGWTKHKAKPTPKPKVSRKDRQDFEKHIRMVMKRERGLPKPKEPVIWRMTREVRKLPSIKAMTIPKLPKPIIQPTKKRKKRHVERSGKTMRALRKVNGVKMFSFPDDVWKVRKSRKRRKK